MPAFFALRCRPTAETARAAMFVASFIVVFWVMASFVVPRFGFRIPGVIVTVFYVVIYFATLSFARRQETLSALGMTRRRSLVAVTVGLLFGVLSVLAHMNLFPGGTLFVPVGWSSMADIVFAGFSAGFVEAVVFYGYFQFRLDEAFGAPIAILITSLAYTTLHAAVIMIPGAGTFAVQQLGTFGFLKGLFIGFVVLTSVVRLTRNIWAGAVHVVIANIFINLYMLSVRPEDVLIGKPSDLPIDALFAVSIVAGLVITRRKIAA